MSDKLVIFDFDGTIADSMWIWDALFIETLEEKGFPPMVISDDAIRAMNVPNFSVYVSEKYPEIGTPEELMKYWHDKMIYSYQNRVSLKPGIIEFLKYLKAENLTVHLASATERDVLDKALERFDLNQYFDFIITEEVVGVSKRDPKIYTLCMEKSGCTAENTYLFEDAKHAVKTGYNLGLNVCAVSDASMKKYVDEIKASSSLYINDFTDLELLKAFLKEN